MARTAPPGRVVAAAGTAARAVVMNVLCLGLLCGVAGAALTFPNLVVAPFAFVAGVYVGALGGAAAGAVHAVTQAVLMLAVPPHARRPASPRLAVVVSALVAAAVYLAEGTDEGPAGQVAWGVAAGGYVVGTWPVANALFPPGRPRSRRRSPG